MFGEGYDLPQLKIAILHTEKKGIANTLQFIGRFTREGERTSTAKFVANIENSAVSKNIKELYREDSNWNKLISTISRNEIGIQIKEQEYYIDFEESSVEFNDAIIDITTVTPKMSTRIFEVESGVNFDFLKTMIVGFLEGEEENIGCSAKGKIWSKKITTIYKWVEWCKSIGGKVTDNSINTETIINNIATPKKLNWKKDILDKERKPLYIKFNSDLYKDDGQYQFKFKGEVFDIFDTDLNIETTEESKINFKITFETGSVDAIIDYSNKNLITKLKNSQDMKVLGRGGEIDFTDWIKENPVEIIFNDGAEVEGHYIIEYDYYSNLRFNDSNLISADWSDTDITSESQGIEKKPNSIQYKVISDLKKQKEFDIIFDDDGSGELADIVCIKQNKENVTIHLFHCKYSSEKKIGSRIKDFYEVCGQAQKSAFKKHNIGNFLKKLKNREVKRIKEKSVSRFEFGKIEDLSRIIQEIEYYPKIDYKITIVQPALDSKKVSDEVSHLIRATDSFIYDLTNSRLEVICS